MSKDKGKKKSSGQKSTEMVHGEAERRDMGHTATHKQKASQKQTQNVPGEEKQQQAMASEQYTAGRPETEQHAADTAAAKACSSDSSEDMAFIKQSLQGLTKTVGSLVPVVTELKSVYDNFQDQCDSE